MSAGFAEERTVMLFTQKWTNLGLAIAFLSTALFILMFLNTGLPDWWLGLTDSVIYKFLCDVVLFIPTIVILLICILANEHFNSVPFRIFNLIVSAFLTSILLVFIVSYGSDFRELFSPHSIAVFLFYTLAVMAALSAADSLFFYVVHISQPLIMATVLKVIASIPLVYIIWHVTDKGWVWLIPVQVFILNYFYMARTAQTWAKISKSYLGFYTYKGPKPESSLINAGINMFQYDNYKKVGLYLTLYNFLPNILNVLSENVNMTDDLAETIQKKEDNKGDNIIGHLFAGDADDEYSFEDFFLLRNQFALPAMMNNEILVRLSVIAGFIIYALACYILYHIGNLFY